MPTCSLPTLCAFFLAALGAALGWGFGHFVVTITTRALTSF
jgi:hypothetical protein